MPPSGAIATAPGKPRSRASSETCSPEVGSQILVRRSSSRRGHQAATVGREGRPRRRRRPRRDDAAPLPSGCRAGRRPRTRRWARPAVLPSGLSARVRGLLRRSTSAAPRFQRPPREPSPAGSCRADQPVWAECHGVVHRGNPSVPPAGLGACSPDRSRSHTTPTALVAARSAPCPRDPVQGRGEPFAVTAEVEAFPPATGTGAGQSAEWAAPATCRRRGGQRGSGSSRPSPPRACGRPG